MGLSCANGLKYVYVSAHEVKSRRYHVKVKIIIVKIHLKTKKCNIKTTLFIVMVSAKLLGDGIMASTS